MINTTKSNSNISKQRAAGILLPLFSLPNKFGIGSLGQSAYNFIDFLSKSGVKYWQMLPLSPTSYGDSPYQSPSAFAGNHYFIDLKILNNNALLSDTELKDAQSLQKNNAKIDYAQLYNTRIGILKQAYSNFLSKKASNKITQGLESFVHKNHAWLNDYAYFFAIKQSDPRSFTLWEKREKYAAINKINNNFDPYITKKYGSEAEFFKFIQYLFYLQWNDLKEYAHHKNVEIIGDMPIYVAQDSADVWASPNNFILNDFVPVKVAGVPPDYFSKFGQKWGNPLYDWPQHKNSGFEWWLKRISHAACMYDVVRIDHFRGFSGYYAVDYANKDARGGSWHKAPGQELFNKIKELFPNIKIIAEDLGEIDDDVRNLMASTGFPGMKVLQFAFSGDNNPHLPQNFGTNNVVYTGTHDNPTTKRWFLGLPNWERERFVSLSQKQEDESAAFALIKMALSSKANIAVIPMADVLNLTNARINTPSKPFGNWRVRLSKNYAHDALAQKLKKLIKKYDR